MDVKKAAMDRMMKLLQNPRVMQVAMNPKVMGAVMKAMSLRGRMTSVAAAASHTVARSLNLATREEIRELRRTVRRLEELVNRIEDRELDDVGERDEG
jgi:hypothetical protein